MQIVNNDWIWNYPIDELTVKQKLEAISQLKLFVGPESHYRILKLEASLRPKNVRESNPNKRFSSKTRKGFDTLKK